MSSTSSNDTPLMILALVAVICFGTLLCTRELGRTAVERAGSWGLEGLYLNSDRHMLPEVYERWGARPWRIITKPSQKLLPRLKRFCGRVTRQLFRRVAASQHQHPSNRSCRD